ncbi:Rrf2 family transcriptional regulator [Moraxella equi]|uniref:HTH-type transcriptional repressor NsrR n=1 Tax=Moraxella equi TaxID=60442 RepID=A0A378QU29_9GAMM|nr:Rrf2 family transcriptional regulator [Moraxella equi]OPH39727.1 Rrf2 family transcriptional regulator [Moraxella equi]STZ03932.1 HTH-type transcriptional repressor NsrR [Moraxella equi]
MKLTNYSDYALRSLIYLAVTPKDGELANIDDIAQAYDISKSHLTKIIHQLGKLGYIESVRGKGGGIRLAKDPSEINIGRLIRHTESDFGILECLDDNSKNTDGKISLVNIGDNANSCVISPACRLKGVFYKAMLAFVAVLDGYTLADVLVNDKELLTLLDKNTG